MNSRNSSDIAQTLYFSPSAFIKPRTLGLAASEPEWYCLIQLREAAERGSGSHPSTLIPSKWVIWVIL